MSKYEVEKIINDIYTDLFMKNLWWIIALIILIAFILLMVVRGNATRDEKIKDLESKNSKLSREIIQLQERINNLK